MTPVLPGKTSSSGHLESAFSSLTSCGKSCSALSIVLASEHPVDHPALAKLLIAELFLNAMRTLSTADVRQADDQGPSGVYLSTSCSRRLTAASRSSSSSQASKTEDCTENTTSGDCVSNILVITCSCHLLCRLDSAEPRLLSLQRHTTFLISGAFSLAIAFKKSRHRLALILALDARRSVISCSSASTQDEMAGRSGVSPISRRALISASSTALP